MSHMLHMGKAKSKDKNQPTCLDQAKSKMWWQSQVGGGKVLGAAMRPMWVEVTWKLFEKRLGRCQIDGISKDLRKKANISLQALFVLPCVYLC
jgi:hypothetical protein